MRRWGCHTLGSPQAQEEGGGATDPAGRPWSPQGSRMAVPAAWRGAWSAEEGEPGAEGRGRQRRLRQVGQRACPPGPHPLLPPTSVSQRHSTSPNPGPTEGKVMEKAGAGREPLPGWPGES